MKSVTLKFSIDWKKAMAAEAAIDAFENSDVLYRFLPKELVRNLVQTKRQELHYLAELTPEERVELYLDTV